MSAARRKNQQQTIVASLDGAVKGTVVPNEESFSDTAPIDLGAPVPGTHLLKISSTVAGDVMVFIDQVRISEFAASARPSRSIGTAAGG